MLGIKGSRQPMQMIPKETRPIARYALDQPVSSTSIKKTVKSNFFPGSNLYVPHFDTFENKTYRWKTTLFVV